MRRSRRWRAPVNATWTGAVDKDIANGGNWSSGSVPDGTASFNLPVDGPLTMSADKTFASVQFLNVGTIGLDLGAARTLTVGGSMGMDPGAFVTLSSGTFKHSSGRFFVGDNCQNCTFIVDGADAKLCGSTGTGNDFIQIGSSNGENLKAFNNLIKVQNGGYLSGWVKMGRMANGGDSVIYCGTNTLWVTGKGSHFEGNANNVCEVGIQQGYSFFRLDDQATATIRNALKIGMEGQDNNGKWRVGGRNRVDVRSGANLTVDGTARLGANSASNVMEVADGGRVTVTTDAVIGFEVANNLTNVAKPTDNALIVTGPNSSMSANNLTVGNVLGADRNSVTVADGATLSVANCVSIGEAGDGNVLCVSNAVLDAKYWVYLGYSGSSNLLEIAEGGKLSLKDQLRYGFCNRADGTKNRGNRIWVHGKGALLANDKDAAFIWLERHDGQIGSEIAVEDGGTFISKAPLHAPRLASACAFSSNLQIRVTGVDSKFLMSGEFALGYGANATATNLDAEVYVADGGLFSASNCNCFVGYAYVAGSVCEGNRLVIGKNGRFEQNIEVYRHTDGSIKTRGVFRMGENEGARKGLLKVEGDFLFRGNGDGLRGPYDSVFAVGYNGPSNRMEVVNGGKALIDNGGFTVARYTSSTGTVVYVGAESELCVTNTEVANLGVRGAQTLFAVDGGSVNLLGADRTVVGAYDTADGCRVELKNGATADMTRLVLGDAAANCVCAVDDSTLNLVDHDGINSAGFLDIGYQDSANNATLRITGRRAKVRADRYVRMRNATSKIEFVIPKEGFDGTPLTINRFWEVKPGASIHVSADKDWPDGSKVTLVEAASEGVIADLTLTCDPGLVIRRSGTRITAAKPGGMVILIR